MENATRALAGQVVSEATGQWLGFSSALSFSPSRVDICFAFALVCSRNMMLFVEVRGEQA